MNKELKNESGMSLIEAMIAIVVLLIGMLTLAQALTFSVIASKTQGRDSGKATASAHDKMEELVGLQFSDTTTNLTVPAPYPTNGVGLTAGGSVYPSAPADGYVDYLDASGTRTGSNSSLYTRQWQIMNESAGSKRIIVSVHSDKSFGVAPSTFLVTQKTQ